MPPNRNRTEDIPDVDIGSELDQHILCCTVTVHRWRGQFKIRDALVKVGEAELAQEFITNPRWNLLPEYWAKQFNDVENKIQGLVDSKRPLNSSEHKFPLRGIDIIPRKVAPQVFREIRKIETEEFYPLVNKFVDSFPSIVESIKQELITKDPTRGAKNFELLRCFLPNDMGWLRNRFSVEKHIVPIRFAMGEGFAHFMGTNAEEFASEIGSYTKKFAQDTAHTIVAGIQEELVQAVDNLRTRIDEKGIIKSGTLQMVKDAFSKLKDFDVFMAPNLVAQVQAIEQRMTTLDHQLLNKDLQHEGGHVAAGLASVLAELSKNCEAEASSILVHGRGRRSVE